MSIQKDKHIIHPDPERVLFAFFTAIVVTMIIVCFSIAPRLETKVNGAIANIEAEQIAEGERYTAVVSSIDISRGLLIMDNGDEIPVKDLSAQPANDDKLTYIKTFDYEFSNWNSMPKRLDDETITNIEIIGQVSD